MMCMIDQNPLNIAFMHIMKENQIECYYSDIPSDTRVVFHNLNNMIDMVIQESVSNKHTHKLVFGGINVHTQLDLVIGRNEIFFYIDYFWVEK